MSAIRAIPYVEVSGDSWQVPDRKRGRVGEVPQGGIARPRLWNILQSLARVLGPMCLLLRGKPVDGQVRPDVPIRKQGTLLPWRQTIQRLERHASTRVSEEALPLLVQILPSVAQAG